MIIIYFVYFITLFSIIVFFLYENIYIIAIIVKYLSNYKVKYGGGLKMCSYIIYCDDLQEGMWFKKLNSHFANASLKVIPSSRKELSTIGLDKVLKYDRPDIVLMDEDQIIFVLERTVEVPSGHNVGQRYGRLLAAAQERIPVVYFGPYAAYKHGGNTAGPRYMNLRLFYSLTNVSNLYNTAITTINWPVDRNYEVLRTPVKDIRIQQYLELFFSYYDSYGFSGLTEYIKNSQFQLEQLQEQQNFTSTEVRSPEQYNVPPESVELLSVSEFKNKYNINYNFPSNIQKIVLYHVGMAYIRSDPYTGMAALYKHLYADNNTYQILEFAQIESKLWYNQRPTGKTYRMYKEFSDAIIFSDNFILHRDL